MRFFSFLFNEIMNQSNDNPHQSYQRRERTAEDYIRSCEIEQDNYDDGKRNTIDERGELPESREDDECSC